MSLENWAWSIEIAEASYKWILQTSASLEKNSSPKHPVESVHSSCQRVSTLRWSCTNPVWRPCSAMSQCAWCSTRWVCAYSPSFPRYPLACGAIEWIEPKAVSTRSLDVHHAESLLTLPCSHDTTVMRIATTASPVSGADVRDRMIELHLKFMVQKAVNLVGRRYHEWKRVKQN